MIIKYNRISSFDSEPSVTGFSKSDLFLKSSKIPSVVELSSYSVSGDVLYEKYKQDVGSRDFNFSGNWNFDSFLGNALSNIDELSSAVTVEWCNQNLRSQLSALSCQLYTNPNSSRHLPSYVGQVIVSFSLSSEFSVRQVYGQETRWKKIQGRFLLGAGTNAKNDSDNYGSCKAGEVIVTRAGKMGGAKVVSLKNSNVPAHSHKFDGAEWGSITEDPPTVSMRVGVECDKVYGVICTNIYDENMGSKRYMWHRDNKDWAYGEYVDDIYPTKASRCSIAELTSEGGHIDKSFSFTIKGTVTKSCGTGEGSVAPHENMPKFSVKYIWERVE